MTRCLVFLAATVISAAAASLPVLTVDSATALARSNKLELVAARFAIDEAKAHLRHAGRPANPELDAEFKPNVRGRESGWQLGISQRLPITGRLRAERALSRSELAVAEAEVREFERVVALEAHLAAVELAALDLQIELGSRQIANGRELAEAARRSAGRGESSSLEATQLELETARIEARQLTARSLREAALGELRLMVGLEPGTPVEFRDELGVPKALPAELSTTNHPGLHAVRARVAVARDHVNLARAQQWDEPSLGLFGESTRAEDFPDGRQTDGFVGLRLKIPLPLWSRNEGRLHHAEAAALRAEAETAARERHIRAETHAAHLKMGATLSQLANIETNLLPRAAAIEERLRSQAGQGHGTFSDVLRARESRFDMERSRIDALRDYHIARARYLSASSSDSSR